MNDQFWQSLPQYNASGSRPHEVDITPEDWRLWFNFPQSISLWDGLPKAELERESNRWTFGMAARLVLILAYLAGIAWLIWHFV